MEISPRLDAKLNLELVGKESMTLLRSVDYYYKHNYKLIKQLNKIKLRHKSQELLTQAILFYF